MDISMLEWGSEEYFTAQKVIYKLLFHLPKEPVVLSQCCNDDPTYKDNEGRESCTAGMLTTAQKELDAGNPVVLELFGRRVVKDKGGFGFLYDTVTIYVPGQNIDREFFKKMMKQQTYKVELPPDSEVPAEWQPDIRI